MPSVSYGQFLIAVVYGHLSRKRQDAGRQGVFVKLHPHWMSLQQGLLPVVTQGAVSKKHQPVALPFTHQREEQVATWPQQDQCRPAGHLQLVPKARLTVIHHWVADVITENSATNVVQDLWRVGNKQLTKEKYLIIKKLHL